MKEIITGAVRYLLGNKRLVILNISSLTAGILIIIFSLLLFETHNDFSSKSIPQMIISILMLILGFSVLYSFSLTNTGIYHSRLNEFSIKIMLGSGEKRIFYQVMTEGIIQVLISLIVALSMADLFFSLISSKIHIQLTVILLSNLNTFLYMLLFWFISGFLITFLHKKETSILKSVNQLQPLKLRSYRVSSKVILIVQLIITNIIVFAWGITMPSSVHLYSILYLLILIMGIVVVAISLVLSILYQTEWNQEILLIKRTIGADMKNVVADTCREMAAILIMSSFLSIIFLIIIFQLYFVINWKYLPGLILLLLFNGFFVVLGKKICVSMLKR